MTEDQLRRLLRRLEEMVEPDPEFADQLFADLSSHRRPPSLWGRIVSSWNRSPARWAAVGSTAAAAVLFGAVVGLSINSTTEPMVAGASPTVRPSSTGNPSPTPIPTPQATKLPFATPGVEEPEPSESAAPSAEEPRPAATATPDEGGWGAAGGGGDDGYTLTGTWEPLPAMPRPDDPSISHALLLPDGRVVAFRWTGEWSGEPEVNTLTPGADRWEVVEIEDEASITLGSDQAYVLGADGRLYTHDLILDPRHDRWTVEPFRLVLETDVWAGMPLAAGPDGRIYRPADDVFHGTELVIYDPIADEFSRSSLTSEVGWLVGGSDRLYLLGTRVSSYSPWTDTWQIEPITPPPFDFWPRNAAAGSDGRLYIREWDSAAIWAWNPGTVTWLTVEPPSSEAADWFPQLVTGPDDRLYAIHPRGSFAFTPDESP
jgi:hypothetical protein